MFRSEVLRAVQFSHFDTSLTPRSTPNVLIIDAEIISSGPPSGMLISVFLDGGWLAPSRWKKREKLQRFRVLYVPYVLYVQIREDRNQRVPPLISILSSLNRNVFAFCTYVRFYTFRTFFPAMRSRHRPRHLLHGSAGSLIRTVIFFPS